MVFHSLLDALGRLAGVCRQVPAIHKESAMKRPRLIYYHDSRHYLMYRFDPPMSLHQLRKPVDDLIGTGVDTLVYGTGMGQTFLYDTKVGNKFGENAMPHNSGLVWWRAAANLASALERGLDPFKIIVDRAHEKGIRVLGSIRINDTGAPEGSNYTIGKLKYENPDVMIGEEDPEKPYTATALDFARADVREERLSVIEEICDRYGADGVEIDEYIRVFFKPSEVRQNIPVLTEWMRSIRALLDDIGRRQGRELSLAIRVHPSERACLDIGMDVRTWIREGIVDWVTPFGDVTIIDPEPHFGWMAEDAREAGVGIYPPMGRDTYDDRYHDVTIEMSRAVAGNYREAGADGMYLADLQWPHTNTEYEVLREMTDPGAYARKTKHYPVAPRTARPDPYLPERVLPVTFDEGTTAVVNVPVSDDFDSTIEDDELESVTLGIRLVQPHPNDTITYKINGHELFTSDAKITHFYGGLVPYMPVKVGMPQRITTHYWFEFDVPREVIRRGDNVVEVSMERRWEGFTAERVLQSVDIWVRYKDLPMQVAGQM